LIIRARTASINNKERFILRASPTLLIFGIVNIVLLAILASLISIIEEFR
jgi:hypothetical protein